MTLIQIRRGTSAQWSTNNPVLGSGELGFDTTVKNFKVGDGVTAWSTLPFSDALKANLSGPTFTGTVTLPATTNGLTKTNVGLGNVDNTSDINKPISTAQAAIGTSSPTPNTVMRRDANGRSQVVTPVATADIATKGYVDNMPGVNVWPSNVGSKISFIGDSFTSGYGLTNPTTERWSKLVADAAGAVEVNTGVPSSGYVNQGSGGNSKFSTQATLIATDSTSVIMCGGINDAPLGQTDAQMSTAVNAAITAIQTRAPLAKIFVISPMWHAGQPSADLLKVERQIRVALPSDVTFIERGPWIRTDRVEWQIFDGHPNALGNIAIAEWVKAQLGYSPRGAVQCNILVPGTADLDLNTTNFPAWTLCQDTIWNAKPGWWSMKGKLVMYNSAVNGSVWLTENNSRKITARSDHASTLPSPVHWIETEFWHPGGDLTFKFGYDPNNTTMKVLSNGQTKAQAKWLGPS